ncbi:N-carbamoyl-L-amino-acid hydrolase [Murinocardiopsis flavida]|uniref:N-carbamoyl-L-amino-acid hydrolase n=1 Tax=Murinocardiopsis flavida TaxID=645275 RepID=A0A2P8DQA8_9ACTN|nr:M20 family metallo-hydrolase [Murinocardiopsis flavida]PSK99406.1 N-carbamoyl-L-amino-acid hydrolase [Murinocardiopsis flavida]
MRADARAGPAPDADRLWADLTALAAYADPDLAGWSREVFTDPYRAARAWVRALMADAGLATSVDAVGNITGRLPGTHGGGPPIVTGSHTDTVRGGGRFDGIVGVLGGIEVARRLRETGTRLRRDLVVVDFLGEEANGYGISCMGSRALAGTLTAAHLDRRDAAGDRLGDAMARFGADPAASLGIAWRGGVHAFVELHVEQGPLLEREGAEVGVVTAIAGIERLLATFAGRSDHAGTTPMGERADALTAAAEAVLTVEREGCGAPVHGVATTGRIEGATGAFNIVPDRARIWAELRSVDPGWLGGVRRRVAERIAADAARRGVETGIEWLNDQPPVPADRAVQDVIGGAADGLGASWAPVPSGAGHDAAHLARLGPMGMVFIPSRGGRSHCPEEWTDPAQIATGVHVLGDTIVRLDALDHVR